MDNIRGQAIYSMKFVGHGDDILFLKKERARAEKKKYEQKI